MVKTIGNPLTWLAQGAGAAGVHAGHVARDIAGTEFAVPEVQKIGMRDIRAALKAGIDDFAALRSDVMALCLLYPVIGLTLAFLAFHNSYLPLIYPLIAGFALLGPVAAVGLYEMSRQREAGRSTGWAAVFGVIEAPSLGSIAALAFYMVMLFVIWMLVAAEIYAFTLGPEPPVSVASFVGDVFGTADGWTMAILGTGAGFFFAVVALAVSLVSFPMMIDRHVGVPLAVTTSVAVARRNPATVAAWGLIVAAALAIGSIPALIGLVIVLPVLGHATWHLYRRAIHWR